MVTCISHWKSLPLTPSLIHLELDHVSPDSQLLKTLASTIKLETLKFNGITPIAALDHTSLSSRISLPRLRALTVRGGTSELVWLLSSTTIPPTAALHFITELTSIEPLLEALSSNWRFEQPRGPVNAFTGLALRGFTCSPSRSNDISMWIGIGDSLSPNLVIQSSKSVTATWEDVLFERLFPLLNTCFNASTLKSVAVSGSLTATTWNTLGKLPSLEAVKVSKTLVEPFIDALNGPSTTPKDFTSQEQTTQISTPPPFPALSEITFSNVNFQEGSEYTYTNRDYVPGRVVRPLGHRPEGHRIKELVISCCRNFQSAHAEMLKKVVKVKWDGYESIKLTCREVDDDDEDYYAGRRMIMTAQTTMGRSVVYEDAMGIVAPVLR